jgi:nitrite reductase (NADH) large subunit
MAEHLVVVGNGMVGQRLVEALRDRDRPAARNSDTAGGTRRWRVTVLAEETRPAYDRVNLSAYFDGTAPADLSVVPEDWYGTEGYELHLGEAVTAIDRTGRVVTTSRGRRIGYDALVLATGSAPFVPPVPGGDLPGCFAYRTIDDLDAIRSAAAAAAAAAARTTTAVTTTAVTTTAVTTTAVTTTAVTTTAGTSREGTSKEAHRPAGLVVGGGLLGLEAARALRLLGLRPIVVELAPRLMPLQVDEGGGALLRRLVQDLDVQVRVGTSVTQIIERNGGGLLVSLADGTGLEVDLVVFAAGVRPRDQLARDAGLAIGPRGGVLVDEACQTSDPHIYAAGECACAGGRVYGLVAPGYAMAEVVADRLTGGGATFTGADTSTKLKLLGVDVASFGDALAATEGALEVTMNDPVRASYAKLVVSGDAKTLLGGVLVGDASRYGLLRPLVGRPLPGDPVTMIAPEGTGAGSTGLGAGALPGDAQVCTCHGVTKDAICGAIARCGLSDVAGVKSETKAGTGCGSCLPTLKTLLADSGVTASSALCEHFAVTRGELFEIVRAEAIGTFTELIERHGSGRGCDICKPAVASILASLGRGRHILDGEQAALQDTNDHFLANIQRNGTYSVVPRIPGGEVTPEQLIVLGEVARDFSLYTKITGGQRIDLLGARVEQLPAIWRRLVEAGFESGHAYGKAVRTVKSCIGSAWCRYGVQDSVSLAVELELRYRGIRSPHKIKAGVSGCARECAEARSKDIGVIAAEDGWNLYVGGNGGFRPRHADLLLSGVDTPTLIRTIDRFLMFYIRTADRLQRTASWLESLDGGLGYLRSVIVEDSLGIAAELDAAIEAHVAGYADEWAAVLADPAKLSRFVSFVNAPGMPDPSIAFVAQRGQPRPVELAMPARLEVAR